MTSTLSNTLAHAALSLLLGTAQLAHGACDGPTVVAHRGSMTDIPENTLDAFDWAHALGVDAIELDVRFTRDGHPIVMHDATVNRTTNGRGRIDTLLLAELRRLSTAGGGPVPTLAEALAWAQRANSRVLLDLKDPAPDLQQILTLAHAHKAAHVVLGVRTLPALAAVQANRWPHPTLAFVSNVAAIDAFIVGGADIIRLKPRWLARNPGLAGKVRAAGACVWTTSGDRRGAKLAQLVQLGAQGLITNHPGHAVKLLRQHADADGP